MVGLGWTAGETEATFREPALIHGLGMFASCTLQGQSRWVGEWVRKIRWEQDNVVKNVEEERRGKERMVGKDDEGGNKGGALYK